MSKTKNTASPKPSLPSQKPVAPTRTLTMNGNGELAPVNLTVLDVGAISANSATRQLIEYVRAEGYRVGDRLPSIRQLSETLSLNRNVVRDALLEAQTKGLVRIQPRSGAYLQSLNMSSLVDALSDTLEAAMAHKDPNVLHLIEGRSTIEERTVEIAAGCRRPDDLAVLLRLVDELRAVQHDREARIVADEKFHMTIAGIAGNSVLVIVLRALMALLRPYRLCQVFSEADREIAQHEHEEIYNAIRSGDAAEAAAVMRRHILALEHTMLHLPRTQVST